MSHPRRTRIQRRHGACEWSWHWRLATPPRLRRRDGEKLSLFRHDLPLPFGTEEEGLTASPAVAAALPEPWAPTGTESERGA